MSLGLIGWYGHTNYCDERILYCIRRFFSDYELFVSTGWDDAGNRQIPNCSRISCGCLHMYSFLGGITRNENSLNLLKNFTERGIK